MRRLKHWGRCIRGDYLTAQGKRLVLLGAITPAWVANIIWGGIWAWIVIAMFAAWLMSFWITADTGCSDEDKQIYESPSGEAELIVCRGCESWMLRIRGDERGVGKGVDSLIKRLNDLSKSHQQALPVIAQELSQLAATVEEVGSLGKDVPISNPEGGKLPTKAEASDQIEKIIDSVTKGVTEGKTIGEALSEAGSFVGDSSEGLGMGIIVDGEQYKRFTEFIESRGETVNALGRVEARAVNQPKPKKTAEVGENCQDCGQKLGEDHLKTCPYAADGAVAEKHTKASSAS